MELRGDAVEVDVTIPGTKPLAAACRADHAVGPRLRADSVETDGRQPARSSRRGSARAARGARSAFPTSATSSPRPGAAGRPAGFVIPQGCAAHEVVPQPRASATAGRWCGLLVEMAFQRSRRTAGLDVKEKNERALALYRDEGSHRRRLQDSVAQRRRYESLIVRAGAAQRVRGKVAGDTCDPLDDDGRAARQPSARPRRRALPDEDDRLAPPGQDASTHTHGEYSPAHARSAQRCSRSA